MRYRGVHYDTGVHFVPSRLSRENFDTDLVRFEIQTIAEDLHGNAIRIIGEDLDRMEFAAATALDHGLAVFLSPWLIDRGEAELLPFLDRASRLAERLRGQGEVVFVAGCELSLFSEGFVPGADLYQRIDWLVSLRNGNPPVPSLAEVSQRLDALLRRAVEVVRREFHGTVTYSSGVWETVDWTLFDAVGVDYYRAEQTTEEYAEGLRALAVHGKPVFVLEFGCCTYEGADLKGGLGWANLKEWSDGGPQWVAGPPVRSEATQARYLTDQLDVFAAEGIEGAFVFTMVVPYLRHDPDPARDFEMSSYGLVKMLPLTDPRSAQLPPWEPKESFHALAARYQLLAKDTPGG